LSDFPDFFSVRRKQRGPPGHRGEIARVHGGMQRSDNEAECGDDARDGSSSPDSELWSAVAVSAFDDQRCVVQEVGPSAQQLASLQAGEHTNMGTLLYTVT
jgi:hypothetical protein